MADLEERFRSLARTPAPELWPEIDEREPRHSPGPAAGRRIAAAAVAFAVALTGIGFAIGAFTGEKDLRQPGTTVSAPFPAPLVPRAAATIEVGAFPRAVAVGEGAVWAAVSTGEPDGSMIIKIDPTTNEIVGTIPTRVASDIAVGDGALWTTSWEGDEGVLLRIDPATLDVVATIPVGRILGNVAYGFGDVWVTRNTSGDPFADELVRVDPATNQVVARVRVEGGEARDVVVGEGSVWVYGHSRHTGDVWEASSLWRIDPTNNEVIATVIEQAGFLGAGAFLPDNVAVGGGWAWAADDRGRGVRIDPATGAFTTFELAEGGFAWPYAAYEGNVFFGLGTVRVLDMETLEVVGSIALDSQVADAALDPAMGTLWIANYEGTVTRIDLH